MQLPQRTMRAHWIVVGAPRFYSLACIVGTDERMLVQTFFTRSAIEVLDVRVFQWLKSIPFNDINY